MDSKKEQEQAWQHFIALCAQIDSPAQLKKFFDLFLTIEEKATLASRYLILKALVEGKHTQREIADIFGVSISQITRGSNALKIIDEDLRNLLKPKTRRQESGVRSQEKKC